MKRGHYAMLCMHNRNGPMKRGHYAMQCMHNRNGPMNNWRKNRNNMTINQGSKPNQNTNNPLRNSTLINAIQSVSNPSDNKNIKNKRNDEIMCWNCGKKGHYANDCKRKKNKKKKEDEQKKIMVLDSYKSEEKEGNDPEDMEISHGNFPYVLHPSRKRRIKISATFS